MRRLLYIFFVVCLIIGASLGGIFFVNYLKMNNLLFFATGTKEKAFLNTTWRMSPKEVARATGLPLLEMTDNEREVRQDYRHLYGPHLMNKNRFQERKQKISLCGECMRRQNTPFSITSYASVLSS